MRVLLEAIYHAFPAYALLCDRYEAAVLQAPIPTTRVRRKAVERRIRSAGVRVATSAFYVAVDVTPVAHVLVVKTCSRRDDVSHERI